MLPDHLGSLAGVTGGEGSAAQRALSDRPSVSIRARIIFALLLCFVMICAITWTGLTILSSMARGQEVLEVVSDFALEVQTAHRHARARAPGSREVQQTLLHLASANRYVERYGAQMEAVVGRPAFDELRGDLRRYRSALTELAARARGPAPGGAKPDERIAAQLRRFGAELLVETQDLVDRQRMRLHGQLLTATRVAVAALALMLLILTWVGVFLTAQVLRPLGRFMRYTQRIADGDYSPITPARAYRDEFSTLAMAFNQMLAELERRQEQLVQSRKMAAIGTLTAGIAHELNNPLNNIGITTESLIDGFDRYEAPQKLLMLRQIHTQVERSSATVRNLLDFTRQDTLPLEPIPVRELVEATATLAQNELTLAGVELEVSLPELPPLRGNARDLQQVLLNLFLNATQALPEGGRLSVRGQVQGPDEVRIDVADSGEGIAPQHLDKIFDPFFTTKEVGQGTGLGLSVSYAIVKKHGGRITVQSEPGQGAVFSLFLPSWGAQPPATGAEES
jgi:signal transduction histidine kinase